MSLTKVSYSMITGTPINVLDYGADSTGATDSSAAIRTAWIAAAGKELVFPAGTYSFYLDVSGLTNPVTVTGYGNVTFRPFSSTPTNSAVIYCNNNNPYVSGVMVPMGTTFMGINFTGRKLGTVDPVYGDVDYCVNLLYSSAKFYRCSFSYGKVAGFHALFGQYNEFYDCLFGGNIYGGVAIGCFIESNGVPNSANENKFFSCKFNTNSVGLKITGGIQNKVYAAQIQANTVGLQIGADGTGFGTNSNLFSGVYFEANTTDIQGTVCVSQVFDACNFVTAGSVSTFSHAYNLVIQNCSAYAGTTITINHPSGNADTASVTCIGNNFDPVLSLSHSGAKTQLNINSANAGLSKNLNLWNTVDQNNNQTGGAYLTGPQYGFKPLILRTVATPLFSLIQYSTSAFRYSKFTLDLQCVEDELVAASFGYAARNESFEVFITNNTTSAPQVYVSTVSGVDLGINTGLFAIGAITLTSVVTGNVIQFKISWSGSGSAPSTYPSICCGYTINYTGLGATTFLPL